MRRWILIVLLMVLGLGGGTPPAQAAETGFNPDLGEQLTYRFSFLWFDRFGEGALRFGPGPEPGTYLAVAQGRTLGLAAWLSKDRSQVYECLMRRDTNGLLRPIRTRSLSIKGNGDDRSERISEYLFDYAEGMVHYRKFKKGKLFGKVDVPLPTDHPVFDLLSAFYNWRMGLLGEMKPGSVHILPTITKKGPTDIVVGIRTREDHLSRPEFPKTGFLSRVIVDEEVFGTKGGKMFVWIDPDAQPGKLLVEGVLGLGDVWAVKEQAGLPPASPPTALGAALPAR